MSNEDAKEFIDAYSAWSADDLKKYQTKITKLANSLDKDVVSNNCARTLFSSEDIEAMTQAINVLRRFKDTVQHSKENMQREEARQERLKIKAFNDAEKSIYETFKLETVVDKTIFSLCVQRLLEERYIHINNDVEWDVKGHIEHGDTLAFLETRASNCTQKWISKLAGSIIDYAGMLDTDKRDSQFKSVFSHMNDMHSDDKAVLKMLTEHISIITSDNVVKLN